MYKHIVRAQLVILFLALVLVAYKSAAKPYDPMFYDTLLFGRIHLFWFVHLVFAGIILAGAFFLFKKFDSRSIIFTEISAVFTIILFLAASEVYFRFRPVALPLDVLEELGFTYRDKEIKDQIKFTMTDKYNDDSELGIINKPNLNFMLRTREFSYPYRSDSQGFQNFDHCCPN